MQIHFRRFQPVLPRSGGAAEALALASRVQVDPREEHGQLRRLEFDTILGDQLRQLEASCLETFDVGITIPSLLWRYTKFVQSDWCRHEASVSIVNGRDGSWE
jgi:hypothetical protein